MTTVFLFVAAYFALLALLGLLARPYRLRMRAIADELLQLQPTEAERKFIFRLVDTAYSVRTAPVIFLVFVVGILQRSEVLDRDSDKWAIENPRLSSDRRSHELLEMHMVSAAVVNPIFGALAYVTKWVFRAKARAYIARTQGDSKSIDLCEMKVVSA